MARWSHTDFSPGRSGVQFALGPNKMEALQQACPKSGPRAKSGLRSNFDRPSDDLKLWTEYGPRQEKKSCFAIIDILYTYTGICVYQAFRNDSKELNDTVTIPFFFNDSFFYKRNWTERGTRENSGLHVQFLF